MWSERSQRSRPGSRPAVGWTADVSVNAWSFPTPSSRLQRDRWCVFLSEFQETCLEKTICNVMRHSISFKMRQRIWATDPPWNRTGSNSRMEPVLLSHIQLFELSVLLDRPESVGASWREYSLSICLTSRTYKKESGIVQERHQWIKYDVKQI